MAANGRTQSRRRAQLSRDSILEAALTLTAEGEQVTFRALGGALGADPTAVYRHFRDKDELVRAAYDRIMEKARAEVDESSSWREQIRQLAILSWENSEQHPHIAVDAPILTTGGPGELGCIDLMLGCLRAAGLGDRDVVRFYGVIGSYILSISANISAQKLAAADQGTDINTAWLYDVSGIDATRYPNVAASRYELGELSNDDVYLTGIDVLLDAVEAAAQAEAPTVARARQR
ncbi:TetR family transcriptional regulator [Nocardioides sp. MAH-18]|uniref:TetR family transcriptional regulator n=1 Tax=Nocardioides agri TaxID=2682843 RepID=A0A6L6XNL5_9ACTN|nr:MULTISPECIES: TetR/AcrR family transcriptional regulator [unclassified Nocardioides]MBA2953825.1 TetR/AcrR family transcriptional regulator [Nocardioides sp. CGMCC 1.13656]MVQ48690.1 TetR family transcriptional regulator [Nocardioides sp. MAH-18]